MLDDLRALAIFAKVAEAGSFSVAARALRLSTSVVSHHVKTLETRHGVSLLHRSTRALSLTSDGQSLLDSAQRMVAAAEEGLDAIADISATPSGTLRVTAPAFFANSPQESAIWKFAERYPNVTVTLNSSDERINLVAEGFDLAIRLGQLSDSGLRSRAIGTFARRLVATQSFLETIDEIKTPKQLISCDFVALDMLPDKFVMQQGKKEFAVEQVQTRIAVNSVAAARSAVLAGLGMQRLPLSEVSDDLAAGRLVEVLPKWQLPEINIYAVWPASSHRSTLVRLLLDSLVS